MGPEHRISVRHHEQHIQKPKSVKEKHIMMLQLIQCGWKMHHEGENSEGT